MTTDYTPLLNLPIRSASDPGWLVTDDPTNGAGRIDKDDLLDRANHVGQQTASTISDFDAAVKAVDDPKYLKADGTVQGATSQAQDFANGIKADSIAESTTDNGVDVDGVKLKDKEALVSTLRIVDASDRQISKLVADLTADANMSDNASVAVNGLRMVEDAQLDSSLLCIADGGLIAPIFPEVTPERVGATVAGPVSLTANVAKDLGALATMSKTYSAVGAGWRFEITNNGTVDATVTVGLSKNGTAEGPTKQYVVKAGATQVIVGIGKASNVTSSDNLDIQMTSTEDASVSNVRAVFMADPGQPKKTHTLNFNVDGSDNVPATGLYGPVRLDAAYTIKAVRVYADAAGDLTVDIQKTTHATYGTYSSICGGSKPTLSAADKYEDATLSGWTTTIAAGDILAINIDSIATIKSFTVAIELEEA